MSIVTIIKELWRFLLDNIVKIVLGAILIAFLSLGIRYTISNLLYANQKQSLNYLEEVYQQEAAYFRAVITIDDGQLFSNPNLYDDYFTSPEIVAEVTARSGVDVAALLASEKNLELFKTPTYRGGIAGIRDNASGIFTFRFLVGKTAEDNLKVAQAYRDLLVEKKIPFADRHLIDIIVEPSLGEVLDLETYTSVANPSILNVYQSNRAPQLVIFLVLGFIIGLLLMLTWSMIQRFRKDTINYAFEYLWDVDDSHTLIPANQKEVIGEIIAIPAHLERWIILQNSTSLETKAKSNGANNHYFASLSQLGQEESKADEIVLIIYANQTNKQWFNAQMKWARRYQIPIRIMHIYPN